MGIFEQFKSRTWVQATLEMETALAVGSRLSLEPTGTDMPVIKGPDGLPFIPGSSIKGVVRFQAERFLRAANRRPNLWACDPFDSPCVNPKTKDELWKEAKGQDAAFAQKVWDRSCTACRLFGSPWFAGRVAFKDAFLLNPEEMPVLIQIRDGVGIDRDLGVARTGVKYDFETVVPGARFGLEILAENLEDWEIGFLLTVLQMWKEGGIPLGGKSTRGTGWGRLKDLSIRQVDVGNLMGYLLNGESDSREPARFTKAFQNWLQGLS
ncbi:MAG: type III CRISPR-associated RAMP protein Csx7 [Anaerolineae bacterium]